MWRFIYIIILIIIENILAQNGPYYVQHPELNYYCIKVDFIDTFTVSLAGEANTDTVGITYETSESICEQSFKLSWTDQNGENSFFIFNLEKINKPNQEYPYYIFKEVTFYLSKFKTTIPTTRTGVVFNAENMKIPETMGLNCTELKIISADLSPNITIILHSIRFEAFVRTETQEFSRVLQCGEVHHLNDPSSPTVARGVLVSLGLLAACAIIVPIYSYIKEKRAAKKAEETSNSETSAETTLYESQNNTKNKKRKLKNCFRIKNN